MPNLNLNTIALVSTLRPAPYNGAPITEDYNDSQNETLLDLTATAAFINNILIPMLVALPESALSGLEGRALYGDSTDQTTLFYDPVAGEPLSISDSLRQLNALVANNNLSVSNIAIQVGQLQQKLSSTNQNNIAITLQNLTNSLNTLTNQQVSTDSAVTELQSSTNKIKANRAVFSIPASSTANYEIDWLTPYPDNGYTATLGLQQANTNCKINGFVYVGTGIGLLVSITNSSGSIQSVTVHATGIHD